MDNIKGDSYYASKAVEDIDAIIKYTKGKTFEEFIADEQLIDATMFRLIQLVENVKHVSQEFKDKHHEIKWGEIIGFRNGIVHNYGKTDFTIVYETISKDIMEWKSKLEEII